MMRAEERWKNSIHHRCAGADSRWQAPPRRRSPLPAPPPPRLSGVSASGGQQAGWVEPPLPADARRAAASRKYLVRVHFVQAAYCCCRTYCCSFTPLHTFPSATRQLQISGKKRIEQGLAGLSTRTKFYRTAAGGSAPRKLRAPGASRQDDGEGADAQSLGRKAPTQLAPDDSRDGLPWSESIQK